ncbi:hypothetical protein [Streptomyces sp. SAI-127]|uniref:hypothetical protein n=1 Tax=Streptomyces sp. SAI-127 TaxID=2940543 RepID=UPI0024759B44|nr:hypothetical protein [Streptomyces sp. SAI-127]MDH6489665.1 hypothetical protein [Streptomyces sp. SAI-127]
MTGTAGSLRLIPQTGQASGVVSLDAAPANTWVPVPGTDLLLPVAGLYEVTADVQGSIGGTGSLTNAIVDARVFDVTAGAAVPMAERRVILFTDQSAEPVVHGVQADASAAALYQVASPTTVRVEGSWRTDAGATSGRALWAHNFRFKRIA